MRSFCNYLIWWVTTTIYIKFECPCPCVSVAQFFQCRKYYNYYKYVNIKQLYCQNQRSFYSVKSYFIFWFEQKLYSFMKTTILWYTPSAQGQRKQFALFYFVPSNLPNFAVIGSFRRLWRLFSGHWHFCFKKAVFKIGELFSEFEIT